MFRVLITGSRSWGDYLTMMEAIFKLQDEHGEILIVHGDCPKGADHLASEIATRNSIPQERHPADWSTYGKRAGFVRNEQMVSLGADCCLAFIKDGSSGATMTAKLAAKSFIPLEVFEE